MIAQSVECHCCTHEVDGSIPNSQVSIDIFAYLSSVSVIGYVYAKMRRQMADIVYALPAVGKREAQIRGFVQRKTEAEKSMILAAVYAVCLLPYFIAWTAVSIIDPLLHRKEKWLVILIFVGDAAWFATFTLHPVAMLWIEDEWRERIRVKLRKFFGCDERGEEDVEVEKTPKMSRSRPRELKVKNCSSFVDPFDGIQESQN